MSGELRFSLIMLFKKAFWRSVVLRTIGKPVRPTLRLSKEALETPLPEGPLRDIRDFLTRRGPWIGLPIDSVELFMAIPAPGVSIQKPLPSVVGIDEPIFTSLGFGVEGISDGVATCTRAVCDLLNSDIQCDTHLCITQTTRSVTRPKPDTVDSGAIGLEVCHDNFCGTNDCVKDSCTSQKCHTQWCESLSCGDHVCGTKTSISFSSEVEAHWDHPFVRELCQYFRVDRVDALASAVTQYVGRNMFDESAR